MAKNRHPPTAGVLLGLALLAFAGCGRGGEPVRLTMSIYKQEITGTLPKLLAAFQRENPGIAISVKIHPNDGGSTNAAAAAAGQLPDIVQTASYAAIRENVKNGYYLDLSDQPVMAQVLDRAKPAVSYGGRLYAVPMDFSGIGVIYNRDLFEKYKLDPPKTFSELRRAAEVLRQNRITPFAGLLKENWSVGHFLDLLHSSMLGAKSGGAGIAAFVDGMNRGKTSWASGVDVDRIFRIMDWYKDNMGPNAAEMAWEQQQAAYAQGECAMMVQGLWALPNPARYPRLRSGFIPFPWSNDPADNKFFADVDSTFAVSAQSSPEKQAAALRFVNWLGSREAIRIWTGDINLASTFKNADLSAMPPPFQELMRSVDAAGSYPWVFAMMPSPTWEQAVKNGAYGYLTGKLRPDEVAAGIDGSWKANFQP